MGHAIGSLPYPAPLRPPARVPDAAPDALPDPAPHAPDAPDARALMVRLRAGDHAAFDTIFRTWYAPLVRLARRRLQDEAQAEEIVQEVLLELWRRRATLPPETVPHAYLFQAVRNRSLNLLRHARTVDRAAPLLARADDVGAAGRADAAASAAELAEAVTRAVAALPPRCREVFVLSRVQGLRYGEIAGTLGVTVKAVEANMGRALRTLRTHLAAWLPDDDRR